MREEIAAARARGPVPDFAAFLAEVRRKVEHLRQSRLRPLINATGVLIHTNFGRAPLANEALAAISTIGSQYSNLEFDLEQGERGHRGTYVEEALAALCSAQAATVVNNCAAALVLIVSHFTRKRRQVLISRGELVQIGGGFRIPEILEVSGAELREVGTTNRTSAEDYRRAISREVALILKVHRSNFVTDGFVSSASARELAPLAKRHHVLFVEDLGAGALWDTASVPGLTHEPTPAESLRNGADLVTFSGDKLMGGPQAGLIAGRKKLVASLKHDPLFRALRCDKLLLSALEATVELYLNGAARARIPVIAMAQTPIEVLRSRAEALKLQLSGLPLRVEVGTGASRMGGGGLPGCCIESATLELVPADVPLLEFSRRLLNGNPPVVGLISRKRLVLDLRTVFPEQDDAVAAALRAALQS